MHIHNLLLPLALFTVALIFALIPGWRLGLLVLSILNLLCALSLPVWILLQSSIYVSVAPFVAAVGIVYLLILWFPEVAYHRTVDRVDLSRTEWLPILKRIQRGEVVPILSSLAAIVLSGLAVLLPIYAAVGPLRFARTGTISVQVLPESKIEAFSGTTSDYFVGDDGSAQGKFTVEIQPTGLKTPDRLATIRIRVWAPFEAYQDANQMRSLAQQSISLLLAGCSGDVCPLDNILKLPPEGLLRVADSGTRIPIFVKDMQFTLDGDPRLFPNDAFRVRLPVSLVRVIAENGKTGIAGLAERVDIIRSAEFNDFDLSLDRTEPTPVLVFDRPNLVAGFVFAVSLCPLVFGLVLAQLLFRRAVMEPTELASLYASLAAAGLTVLPLRATLIPTDIQTLSLTRVDLVLATELGALAAIASLAYLHQLRTAPKRDAPAGAPHNAQSSIVEAPLR